MRARGTLLTALATCGLVLVACGGQGSGAPAADRTAGSTPPPASGVTSSTSSPSPTPSVVDTPLDIGSVDACALLGVADASALIGQPALSAPDSTVPSGGDSGQHCVYAATLQQPVDGRQAGVTLLVFPSADAGPAADPQTWLDGYTTAGLCRRAATPPEPAVGGCTFDAISVADVLKGGQSLQTTLYPASPPITAHGTSVLWWQGGLVFELTVTMSNQPAVAAAPVVELAGQIARRVG